jgi:hypothetical protein
MDSETTHRTTAFAKADTPFGPLAGRTQVNITHNGYDLALVTFNCGDTKVTLSIAGAHLNDLITGLIDQQSHVNAKRNERLLRAVQ